MCEKALKKIIDYLKDGPKTREEIRIKTGLTDNQIGKAIRSNGDKLFVVPGGGKVDLLERKNVPVQVSVE